MEGRTVTLVKKQSDEEKKSSTAYDPLTPLRILTVSREGAVFYRL